MTAVETWMIALVASWSVTLLSRLIATIYAPEEEGRRERERETLRLLAEIGKQLRYERTAASVAVGEALIRVCEAREKADRP